MAKCRSSAIIYEAEMTEGQKMDAALKGHATLKQMSEGLIDGSEEMRRAGRNSLAHASPSFENLPAESEPDTQSEVARENCPTCSGPGVAATPD